MQHVRVMMNIRDELPSDIEKIWQVNTDAFETDAEAKLVNALRDSGCRYISLVAEVDGRVVGHIFFSPVQLNGEPNKASIMGLAPMAVMQQYQNSGIGSALVKSGIERCKLEGYDAIVVLGHPDYYPRFGFVPSVRYGIKSEYQVSDEVFMILELNENSLHGPGGVIKYHAAFATV